MITESEIKAGQILVVDDEPLNLLVVEEIFENAGYPNVQSTTDPKEAVTLFKQQRFDLVLLDLNMPGMDGFEVMSHFSEQNHEPQPPVLVLTAIGDRETRLRALRGGAKDFLVKPFDSEEVLSRAYNLLEVSLAHKLITHYSSTLERAVRAKTRELLETQAEIVKRLGYAAEFRDTETGEHTVRVGHHSRLLAIQIGLSTDEAERILYAAPMHDIGKIGIPDKILLKPGKLDADEWEIMKTHTTIGAKILRGSSNPLIECARTIALMHHEKWDGSGYPKGLKGHQIPIKGRIVAIADVFDALTMSRPYKSAWTIEGAMKLINEQSGIHFDPALVTAFNTILDQLIEIREQYADQ
ncbi:MAG: two-component system response regulator [endosymbiont of Seepiophila jonesi]|uniref:Two-component system response regulator n=1 Tax=endosymbiont of Lamellibrachia luymesi TaxID=2200907 RepID=A0A370DPY7_9GAMM|nr:MAG: two-component system response regulator [endosymbiont of Lamellibrachia luymesi]RDH93144.1 MAG: two-component system response regulator [endosymbiont of Seepiophila jonesi]